METVLQGHGRDKKRDLLPKELFASCILKTKFGEMERRLRGTIQKLKRKKRRPRNVNKKGKIQTIRDELKKINSESKENLEERILKILLFNF